MCDLGKNLTTLSVSTGGSFFSKDSSVNFQSAKVI